MDIARQMLVLRRAIQYHCSECLGYGEDDILAEVADCKGFCCPLYPFRLGANPVDSQESGAYKDRIESWSRRMRGRTADKDIKPGSKVSERWNPETGFET